MQPLPACSAACPCLPWIARTMATASLLEPRVRVIPGLSCPCGQAWLHPCSDRSCSPFEAGTQSLGALHSCLAQRFLTWQLLQHVQQLSKTPPLKFPSAIIVCRRHRAAVRPPQAADAPGQACLLQRGSCQLPALAAIRGQQACGQTIVHLPHRCYASCSSPCRLSGPVQVPGSRAGEASLLLGTHQRLPELLSRDVVVKYLPVAVQLYG